MILCVGYPGTNAANFIDLIDFDVLLSALKYLGRFDCYILVRSTMKTSPSAASIKHLTPLSLVIKWDDAHPTNVRNGMEGGELVLEWDHEDDVLSKIPSRVKWIDKNGVLFIPEFSFLSL